MAKRSDKDVLDELNDRMESVKEMKIEEAKQSKENWKQFSGLKYDKLHVPKTYVQVAVAIAKVSNFLLGRGRLFDISRRGTDDRLKAKVKNAAMDYEIYRIPSFKIALLKNIMQNIIDGKTVLKQGWDSYNKRLMFPFILNKDIHFDPTANLPCDIEWYIQRVVKSKAQLEKLGKSKIFKGLDEFLEKADAYKEDKEQLETSEEYDDSRGYVPGATETLINPWRKHYEIFECWDNEQVVFVGKVQGKFQHIFRQKSNRDKTMPYAIANFELFLNSNEGFGIPLMIKALQKHVDSNRRLRLLASEIAIIGQWKYKPGSFGQVTKDMLIKNPKPGAFSMDKFTDLERIDRQDVPRAPFMEEGLLDSDIEDAGGGFKPLQGKELSRRETLGGIQLLQAAGNERQVLRIILFTEALENIGRQMLKNLFKYHTKELEVKIFDGDEYLWQNYKFSDENMEKEFDLVLRASPTALSPEAQLVAMERLLAVLPNLPGFAQDMDWGKFGRYIMSLIDPKLEHELITPPSDRLINALKKLPPEERETIVIAGLEKLKEEDRISEGMGHLTKGANEQV